MIKIKAEGVFMTAHNVEVNTIYIVCNEIRLTANYITGSLQFYLDENGFEFSYQAISLLGNANESFNMKRDNMIRMYQNQEYNLYDEVEKLAVLEITDTFKNAYAGQTIIFTTITPV